MQIHPRGHRRLGTLGLTVLTLAGSLLFPAPASAHGALITGTPAPGDNIRPGAKVLALVFPQLDPSGAHQVVVTDKAGTSIASGRPVQVDGPGPVSGTTEATLCVSVTPLNKTGVYAIAYQAVSNDGDTVQPGKFYFQVTTSGRQLTVPPACRNRSLPAPGTAQVVAASSAGPVASAQRQSPAPATTSSLPVWVRAVTVVGLAAVLGLAAVSLTRRRRRAASRDR